jgi:hypothetical protein
VKEYALPFIIDDSQKDILNILPIYENLNMKWFQVNDLPLEKYKLTIDSTLIGFFSNRQLAEGINLAKYANTPQMRQSSLVNNLLDKLWLLETDMVTIRYIDKKYLPLNYDKMTMPAKIAHLDSPYQKKCTALSE